MARYQRNEAANIDIKHVDYFLMLAKHGSISKAAHALGLAQPSLTEHIIRLEARLNTKLAIRGPRGITLTEAGQLLSHRGHALIEMAQNLTNSIRELGQDVRGTVSVSIPPSLGMLSIPLVETLRIEAPEIKLLLTEGMTGHTLEWLQQGKIDIGFVYGPPPNSSFHYSPVLEEELFLVAAEDNIPCQADANGAYSITSSDLCELPLAMPSRLQTYRLAIENSSRSISDNLNIIIELDSLSQIVDMVSRASAYSILPHISVANAVSTGRLALIKINNPSLKVKTYIARERNRPASTASMVVERILLKIVKENIQRYDLKANLIVPQKNFQ